MLSEQSDNVSDVNETVKGQKAECVVPKMDEIIFQSENQRDKTTIEHQGSHEALINTNHRKATKS